MISAYKVIVRYCNTLRCVQFLELKGHYHQNWNIKTLEKISLCVMSLDYNKYIYISQIIIFSLIRCTNLWWSLCSSSSVKILSHSCKAYQKPHSAWAPWPLRLHHLHQSEENGKTWEKTRPTIKCEYCQAQMTEVVFVLRDHLWPLAVSGGPQQHHDHQQNGGE